MVSKAVSCPARSASSSARSSMASPFPQAAAFARIGACAGRAVLVAVVGLATNMTHLFELFPDERRTVGHCHMAGRKLLKKRHAVGIDEAHIRQIQHERMGLVAGMPERLGADATELLHPTT